MYVERYGREHLERDRGTVVTLALALMERVAAIELELETFDPRAPEYAIPAGTYSPVEARALQAKNGPKRSLQERLQARARNRPTAPVIPIR